MACWLVDAAAIYGPESQLSLTARLLLEEASRNTAAAAGHTARLLQERELRHSGLITDTLHMPRASYLFHQAFRPLGLTCHPLPAPGLLQDYWRRRRYLRLGKFILREAGAWVKVWGRELVSGRGAGDPSRSQLSKP